MAEQAAARERRVSQSISIMVGIYFLVFVLPMIALFVASIINDPQWMGRISPIVGIGSVINSNVNVFIYALKHQQIKTHMKLLLFNTQPQATRSPVVSMHGRQLQLT